MRAFQLGQPISSLCVLKAGQTPNVDLLKTDDRLGRPGRLRRPPGQLHGQRPGQPHDRRRRHLHVPAGERRRLRAPRSTTSSSSTTTASTATTAMDGSVTLSPGRRTPAHRTTSRRPTASGSPCCWQKPGDVDLLGRADVRAQHRGRRHPRDRTGLQAVRGTDRRRRRRPPARRGQPGLRPHRPAAAGIRAPGHRAGRGMGDDLLVLTWGGNGNDQGNVELGQLYRLEGVSTATSPADVTPVLIADEAQGAAGHQGRGRRRLRLARRTGLIKLVDADGDGVYERQDRRSLRSRSTATSTSSASACSTQGRTCST